MDECRRRRFGWGRRRIGRNIARGRNMRHRRNREGDWDAEVRI